PEAASSPRHSLGRAHMTCNQGFACPAATVGAPGGSAATFVVGVRRALHGPMLDQVLAQLAAFDAIPLVATPYLSPTLRASLADRGVSYADSTGNLRLIADEPGLFIERAGATKDPWPSDETLMSLRGRGAGCPIRASR
ncbi:MAG TPA: hypothetical protein VGV93_14285, partial [Acidimicrobiales bacterium]|nr:hypothetical protein [Acidimicrobiales bacterium]